MRKGVKLEFLMICKNIKVCEWIMGKKFIATLNIIPLDNWIAN
jgi:hypothetical protein